MIRIVLFLLLVGALALAAAWFAERPGDVSVTWLGYQIETSVMVAVAAVAALMIAAVLVWSLLRWIFQSPRRLAARWRDRRDRGGRLAVSRGLIAVGAGDAAAAAKFAEAAERYAPQEPLTLLLRAQAAQLSGDRDAAERAFRRMAAHPDTRLLGLRGLYIEAQRHADAPAARRYAEDAARAAPGLPWAGQAMLEFQSVGGDWTGALATLEASMRGKLLDKETYRRRRAVLLTAQAQELAETRPHSAKALASEAARLAPGLVPAAVLAARLLAANGEARKAMRVLDAAWRENPHPDLADAAANLKSGDSARERLRRVEALVAGRPDHVEASFAVARAALDAQEFARGRTALTPLLVAPTQRVATLMAELEERERADTGRAREWMARALRAPRDPAWTADGIVSEHWRPVSPVTGELDAFQWKVPVEHMPGDAPLIEGGEAEPDNMQALPSSSMTAADTETGWAAERGAGVSGPAGASVLSAPATPAAAEARQPDAVIPLVHAPDDPGPDAETELPPRRNGNGRFGFRSLFR